MRMTNQYPDLMASPLQRSCSQPLCRHKTGYQTWTRRDDAPCLSSLNFLKNIDIVTIIVNWGTQGSKRIFLTRSKILSTCGEVGTLLSWTELPLYWQLLPHRQQVLFSILILWIFCSQQHSRFTSSKATSSQQHASFFPLKHRLPVFWVVSEVTKTSAVSELSMKLQERQWSAVF